MLSLVDKTRFGGFFIACAKGHRFFAGKKKPQQVGQKNSQAAKEGGSCLLDLYIDVVRQNLSLI
jgi:hypothetical protein